MIDVLYIIINMVNFYLLSYLIIPPGNLNQNYFRFLFGFLVAGLASNFLYRYGLSIELISYLIYGLSLILFIRNNEDIYTGIKKFHKVEYFAVITILLLASLGSETYKAFQGHVYDRNAYLINAYVMKAYDYNQISSYLKGLFGFGIQVPLQVDYLFSRGAGEIYNRPAASLSYAISTLLFEREFYRLANAFEWLMKIIFTLTLYGAMEKKLLSNGSRLFALILIQSMYWLQYSKDINSWSMLSVMPAIILLTYILCLEKITVKSRFIEVVALLIFSFLYYPEGTLALGLPIAIYYLIWSQKSGNYWNNIKYILFALFISISVPLLLNYKFFNFVVRQINFSSGYTPSDYAYYLRDLVCAKCVSFNDYIDYMQWLSGGNGIINKIPNLILDMPKYILGIFGYIGSYYIFGYFSIIIILAIIYFLYTDYKRYCPLFLLLFALQIFYLVNHNFLAWARFVNYSSLLISSIFIYFLFNSKTKIALFLSSILLVLSINFQGNLLINVMRNTSNFSKYFTYTWLQDPVYWSEFNGKFLENINFSSSEISGIIHKCDYTFVDINDMWLRTYFEVMLSTYNIKYYKEKNLTGMWDGDISLNRVPLRDFDCILKDINFNSQKTVDLIFINEKQSVLRGNLK